MICTAGHSSGPVHSGKKRSAEVIQSYEKVPRKMVRTEEKEVIHLLPIKDKTGVIPQSVERGTTLVHIDHRLSLIGQCERRHFCLFEVVKKQPQEEEEEEEEEAADELEEFENGENNIHLFVHCEQRVKQHFCNF